MSLFCYFLFYFEVLSSCVMFCFSFPPFPPSFSCPFHSSHPEYLSLNPNLHPLNLQTDPHPDLSCMNMFSVITSCLERLRSDGKYKSLTDSHKIYNNKIHFIYSTVFTSSNFWVLFLANTTQKHNNKVTKFYPFVKSSIMSCPYCNELWVIKSVKSIEVCRPCGLSGSLQKVLLRVLMDWMKCEFGQLSRLADFPWTHLQSPRVCKCGQCLDIWNQPLLVSRLFCFAPCGPAPTWPILPSCVSGFWFWFLAFIPGTCTLFSFYLFYFISLSRVSSPACLCALSLCQLCVNPTILSQISAFNTVSRKVFGDAWLSSNLRFSNLTLHSW